MRRFILLVVLVVSMIAFGYMPASSEATYPVCSSYCTGLWCSGWVGRCWQQCGTRWVLLDCNQSCGAHC